MLCKSTFHSPDEQCPVSNTHRWQLYLKGTSKVPQTVWRIRCICNRQQLNYDRHSSGLKRLLSARVLRCKQLTIIICFARLIFIQCRSVLSFICRCCPFRILWYVVACWMVLKYVGRSCSMLDVLEYVGQSVKASRLLG